MNFEQAMSLLRSVLIAAGSSLGVSAVMTPEQWTTLSSTTVAIISGIVTIAPIIWGVVAKTDKNLVKAAASVDEVKKVQTTKDLAEKVEDPKVKGTTRSHP